METALTMEIALKNSALLGNETTATFTLTIEGEDITVNKVELFEGGFDSIKAKLPEGFDLKCCYGCAYSDYSVYGQGFWGTMMCFKNIKEDYLMVKDKDEYMDIMDDRDRFVQETFYVPTFKSDQRVLATGAKAV
nr:DUF6304 family protein [Paraflavitalea speifideiaquila]